VCVRWGARGRPGSGSHHHGRSDTRSVAPAPLVVQSACSCSPGLPGCCSSPGCNEAALYKRAGAPGSGVLQQSTAVERVAARLTPGAVLVLLVAAGAGAGVCGVPQHPSAVNRGPAECLGLR
jgi:hypothetical protein